MSVASSVLLSIIRQDRTEGLAAQTDDPWRRLDLRHKQRYRLLRASCPGSSEEYADVRLHAGLVCINAPGGLNLDLQRQLFGFILDELAKNGDLINQVLEVDLHKNGQVELRRRILPNEDS